MTKNGLILLLNAGQAVQVGEQHVRKGASLAPLWSGQEKRSSSTGILEISSTPHWSPPTGAYRPTYRHTSPHRKYLRFAYDEYTVLLFGLSLSPCVFCLCVEAGLLTVHVVTMAPFTRPFSQVLTGTFCFNSSSPVMYTFALL